MIDFIDFALSQIPEDKYKKKEVVKEKYKVYTGGISEASILANKLYKQKWYINKRKDPVYREKVRLAATARRKRKLADPILREIYLEGMRKRARIEYEKCKTDPEFKLFIKNRKLQYRQTRIDKRKNETAEEKAERRKVLRKASRIYYEKVKKRKLADPAWAKEYKINRINKGG